MPNALKKPAPEPDEKQLILDKLGDLSQVQIAQNELLLAIFVRPDTNPGGVIALTQKTRKEDTYQGKVGLVVKIGAACRFERKNETTGVIYGIDIRLHDWIVVRPSDTWAMDVSGLTDAYDPEKAVTCRLVFDDQIRMKIPHPRMIW